MKASKRVHNDHFVGLRAASELAGLKRRILVSLADEGGRTVDGIEVMGLPTFLGELERGTLLP